jgi:osmotically-inducible protein OsmY
LVGCGKESYAGSEYALLFVAASALMFGGCDAAHMGKKSPADDTSITNAIEAGLFQDSTLKTGDVRVVSQNGVVTTYWDRQSRCQERNSF